MARLEYRLDLANAVAMPIEMGAGLVARNPRLDDLEPLGRLALEAYRGTTDDEGEDLTQAIEFVGSALKVALIGASWVAADSEGRMSSAILVQEWQQMPLVTFVATHPEHKGRGLARALTQRAIFALATSGEPALVAFITQGNTPSERLFTSLGFRRVQ